MSSFTLEFLAEVSNGYGLDGGGYSFENGPFGVRSDIVVLDDPDLDYMGLQDSIDDYYSHSCPVLAFAPVTGGSNEFPASYKLDDGDVMVKVASGTLFESEQTCNCLGKLVEWTGAAGEPPEPLDPVKAKAMAVAGVATPDAHTGSLMFEHTGNYDDKPFPDCTRCEGEGTLTSHGGDWVLYAIQPDDDDE